MSWYKVGRVAVTNGSTAVVGTGTKWGGKFKPGDIFALASGAFAPYEVLSVTDDTHLTLAAPFTGETGEYRPYVVIQNFTSTTNADLAVRVGQLLQVYEAAVAAPEAAVAAQTEAEAAAQQAGVSATGAAGSAAAAQASEEATAEHALSAATSAAQAVVDTTNAVQAEAAARAGGDTALGARIDTVTARVSTAEAAIVDERTLRVDATGALTASIQAEVAARGTADTALGARITAVETGKADKTGVYTKAETDSRIQAVVGAAPAALDTLAEIATRLGNDADAVAALTAAVAAKADRIETESYLSQKADYAATQAALAGKAPTVHGHAASDIGQDATHRFVTDTEKAAWNAKADNAATEAALDRLNKGEVAHDRVILKNAAGKKITLTVEQYQSADYTLRLPMSLAVGGFWYASPDGQVGIVPRYFMGEIAVLGMTVNDEEPNGGPYPPEMVVGVATKAIDGNGNENGILMSPKAILDAALGTIPAGDANRLVTDAERAKLAGIQAGATAVPTGSVQMFAGAVAPAGWLPCDGAAVSRSGYAALFAVVGTTYGAGDGGTTFNLPDLRDRTPVGVSAGKTRGAKGGSSTVTIGAGNLPAHEHGVTIPLSTGEGMSPTPIGGINYLGGVRVSDDGAGTDWHTHGPYTTTFASGASLYGTALGSGSATPLDVTNPHLALHFIIKT